MIRIRQATPDDAAGIAAVHVATWRTTYAGILPDRYLAGLSIPRHAAYYHAGLRAGHLGYVAESGADVVGFTTAGRARNALADAEIETLYVLDDWREHGAGRRLMQAAATGLARAGCGSVFLWVLRDNPNRWFYQHLAGRRAANAQTLVAGTPVPKTAYVWDPITLLLTTTAPS